MMNLVNLLFVCVLWNERTVLSVKYEEIQLFDTIDKNIQAIEFAVNPTPKKFEGKCPENEVFYLDDEQGDRGECDCWPGYLYHSQSDRCYSEYGVLGSPCTKYESLIMTFNSSSATCVPAQCFQDQHAYRGECFSPIALPNECSSLPNHQLWLNSTTLTLNCLDLNEVQLELNSYHKFCWKGGRRWFKDKCKGKNTKPNLPECPPGEFYYPGDKPGEWRCDCRPGHIYSSETDSCFAAYTRGPCPEGELFVFPLGLVSPICIRNRCPRRGHEVFFQGECYQLRSNAEIKQSRCDFKPGYLYHSDSGRCFESFTRGPCAEYEFFLIPLGLVSPICGGSGCARRADEVFFRGACHQLRTYKPCSPELKLLGVNLTTLNMECLTPTLYSRDKELGKFFYQN